jgi:hypothetical protein
MKDPEESEAERWQRNFLELLQELRVAQTGVQILFAFLLSMVFTPRFAELNSVQRDIYLIALLSSAASTSMIIGPVAFHRVLFRQRRKPELVRIAHRMASAGLAFLVIAMISSIFLVVDVIQDRTTAYVVGSLVALWFLVWWAVLPWLRREERE